MQHQSTKSAPKQPSENEQADTIASSSCSQRVSETEDKAGLSWAAAANSSIT